MHLFLFPFYANVLHTYLFIDPWFMPQLGRSRHHLLDGRARAQNIRESARCLLLDSANGMPNTVATNSDNFGSARWLIRKNPPSLPVQKRRIHHWIISTIFVVLVIPIFFFSLEKENWLNFNWLFYFLLILLSYILSYIHMIFQNNRNVSQKERRRRKNMTIKLIATSLDNKNWKRDQLLLQTVRSASNICLPSSCWKVSRWKSSRFSGVFHRRRQPVEFLPPPSRRPLLLIRVFAREFPGWRVERETSVPPPTPPCRNSAELGRSWLYIRGENVG